MYLLALKHIDKELVECFYVAGFLTTNQHVMYFYGRRMLC